MSKEVENNNVLLSALIGKFQSILCEMESKNCSMHNEIESSNSMLGNLKNIVDNIEALYQRTIDDLVSKSCEWEYKYYQLKSNSENRIEELEREKTNLAIEVDLLKAERNNSGEGQKDEYINNLINQNNKLCQEIKELNLKSKSKIKIADSCQTGIIKVISAMYDCGKFEGVDNHEITKLEVMEGLGNALNADFSKYDRLLSTSKSQSASSFLNIFDELKESSKCYLLDMKPKKSKKKK